MNITLSEKQHNELDQMENTERNGPSETTFFDMALRDMALRDTIKRRQMEHEIRNFV